MGQIVHCGGGSPGEVPRRTAKPNGKRALVLGGGGIAGAAFEIGALLALNDAMGEFTANDFDIFVGTSAGSFLCAFLANGITTEEFARAQLGFPPSDFAGITRREILMPVPGRLRRGGAAWAGAIRTTARDVARRRMRTSIIDTVFSLTEGIASWRLYSTKGLEAYLRRLFSRRGRTNSFDALSKELFITATDLDTAARVVFGEAGEPGTTISRAVAASAAIPIIYEPVRIEGREYLDGGLRSATNLDVAVSHGASLIVLINPLVPYLHDARYLLRGFKQPVSHVSDGGLGRLVAQVFRIMAQAQLDKELELVRQHHPDVDILVLEPRRDDEHLFTINLMDYAARTQVARDGFEQVAVDLVTHFPEVRKLLRRAGIEISKERLLQQLELVLAGGTAEAFIEQAAEETA